MFQTIVNLTTSLKYLNTNSSSFDDAV